MNLTKRAVAELIGTFWLVLGGCGSAVLAAGIPELGLGYLGVSLAFGLTVVTMAYAVGHISGCHLNPVVSVGLVAGGRFKASELPHYIIAQVLGAILACLVIRAIAGGAEGYTGGLASNGFGEHSPHGYSMMAGFICEVVMTAMLIMWINASVKPIANGAKPVGARLSVAPMMMNKNIAVITTSHIKPAIIL